MKSNISKVITIIFFVLITSCLFSQDPPPPPPPGGHGANGTQSGGSASLGSGIYLMTTFVLAYGAKRFYDFQKPEKV